MALLWDACSSDNNDDTSIAWWRWQLNGDQEAKKMFVGDNCTLCGKDAEFEYGHNNLLQLDYSPLRIS